MRTLLAVLTFLIVTASAAGAARADEAVRYVGIHPISAEHGGGFCYIEFPHVHVYAPARPDVLYRRHDDGYHFVGDPVPYGYDGPKQAYYGPHPIYGVDGEEYCYLDGPHYHPYAPTVEASFKLKGGVYFYTGHFPREYTEERPRYVRINAVYRPFHYARPVVVVSPPPEYSGPVYVEEQPATVVVPAHVGVGVGAHVEAGVGFHAGVGIGAGVVIGAPPPPTVIVRPAAPAVIVEERPAVQVIEVRGKKWKGYGHPGRGRGRWK